ncbi:hypothetical protein RDV78_10955 [Bacillota bacterium LX-D]|nr:hypothetical protein [Bacillota bacterium LX-D]
MGFILRLLIDNTNENPDPLIRLLFILNQIAEYFLSMSLGSIIQLLRKNPEIFDKEVYAVTKHEDKERLNKLLKSVLDRYNDIDQQYDINAVITMLKETGLAKSEYIESITDNEAG